MPNPRLSGRVGPLTSALAAAAFAMACRSTPRALVDSAPAWPAVQCGANFSARHAASLGLDPRGALGEVLVDLGVRYLRLPVCWDELEPEPGRHRWEILEWQMAAAAAAGARVLLCVGHKVPRYPEYFAPEWAEALSDEEFRPALLSFVAAAVTRFRDHPALEAWQVENEPLAQFAGWRFGERSRDARRWLDDEIAVVRALDPRHLIVASYADVPWMFTQLPGTLRCDADVVAVSVYRRTYFRSPWYRGYVDLNRMGPVGPFSLRYQKRWAALYDRELWISELQAEPWPKTPGGLLQAAPEELARTMSRQQLLRSWQEAAGAGISRAYLWGVEWLLHRRRQGLDLDVFEFVRAIASAGRGAEAGAYSSK